MYLPIIAHVWNTTPDSDTNITPFEAEHGMKCRSVAEAILQNPPQQGLPAAANDLRAISVSVNAFTEKINNVKALAALKLNENGTSKVTFSVGDQVGFYLPPNQETMKGM